MFGRDDLQFTTSPEVDKFMPAYSKAREDMESVSKDSTNPHFHNRYPSLRAVRDVADPALKAQDITLFQVPFSQGDRVGVITTLYHKSGQWMQCALGLRPSKTDPQGEGSAITYATRYSAMSVCGMVPEDDDGEASISRPANDRERRRDDDRRDRSGDDEGVRRTTSRGRTNPSQAKKEGSWEHLAGSLRLCRTAAEVTEWGKKNRDEINRLPSNWKTELREEREKHLETLAGKDSRKAKTPAVQPLDTPDDNFPPDWERWASRLGAAMSDAKTPEMVDAIWEANGEGLAGLMDVFPEMPTNLHDTREACKTRLADRKDAA